jgi:hypothetical protein
MPPESKRTAENAEFTAEFAEKARIPPKTTLDSFRGDFPQHIHRAHSVIVNPGKGANTWLERV